MVGSCPECGASGSLTLFAAEGALKEAMALALKLPREIQPELLAYLGLFRPAKRALTGARTLRLVRDLGELVAAGTVQIDREPARPCPPRVWAEAMKEMIRMKAGGGGQREHFENHNYLRKVAYTAANRADADREAVTRRAEQLHQRPPALDETDASDGSDPSERSEGISPEAAKFFEAVKGLSGKLSMPGAK